ncbi:MAG TPA: hypothetical protein VEJ63_04805 [Planctomycetota bacterium]|nr:hypothetical protein [Planctomycetota bacterium]
MRKIAMFLLVAFVVTSLVGCGKKEEEKGVNIKINKDGAEVKTK